MAGRLSAGYNYEVISVRGTVKLTAVNSQFIAPASHRTISNNAPEANIVENHVRHYSNNHGFGLYDHHALMMPYWFVAVAMVMLATVPWFSFHFGLRTLLVAITLIGFGFGAILMLSRQ